jgi:hypothetical protein
VVDVTKPEAMRVLSTVPVTDHTWTCVSGVDAAKRKTSCAYAYGRSGHIVDLRDPAKAVLLPQTWRSAVTTATAATARTPTTSPRSAPAW